MLFDVTNPQKIVNQSISQPFVDTYIVTNPIGVDHGTCTQELIVFPLVQPTFHSIA